jgi:hypothetical protein
VEEFMATTKISSKKKAWIRVPSVETWISCPHLNGIPLEDLYIESILVLLYKISSSIGNNLKTNKK